MPSIEFNSGFNVTLGGNRDEAKTTLPVFQFERRTKMGPSHHLKGEEEGEESEDGNLSCEELKATLPRPPANDTIEDALVNNMKQLHIEREAVKKDTEDEDDECECLLKTLTIGVSLQDRKLRSNSITVIWSYSIAGKSDMHCPFAFIECFRVGVHT